MADRNYQVIVTIAMRSWTNMNDAEIVGRDDTEIKSFVYKRKADVVSIHEHLTKTITDYFTGIKRYSKDG